MNIDELEKLAKGVTDRPLQADELVLRIDIYAATADFYAAATPAAILELIERYREAAALLHEVFVIGDRLVDDVYGGEFVAKAKAALARANGESNER